MSYFATDKQKKYIFLSNRPNVKLSPNLIKDYKQSFNEMQQACRDPSLTSSLVKRPSNDAIVELVNGLNDGYDMLKQRQNLDVSFCNRNHSATPDQVRLCKQVNKQAFNAAHHNDLVSYGKATVQWMTLRNELTEKKCNNRS